MLYSPVFESSDERKFRVRYDFVQSNSRLVYDTFEVDNYNRGFAEKGLFHFLKDFGNILPTRHRDLTVVAGQRKRVVSSWSPINPTKFNIHVLSSILRIRVQWVDTLALHLDYDQATRTLSLFRYPSFCTYAIFNDGVTYSFASSDSASSDPRADSNDIHSLLTETLLSFRLLFGQSAAGRKYFRRLYKNNPELQNLGDKLLWALCAEPTIEHSLVLENRSAYFLDRDFPVLSGRIRMLIKDLKDSRPDGWRQLLRDRRDTVQYWTFWLVAIFGTMSIILSIIQVILAGLALR